MAKFCPNCGNEVDEKAVICPKCGVSMEEPKTEKQSNGMAVAGFILSFFFALLGLIFSIIGLNKSKTTNSGRGLSIAGIIISIISMVLAAIMIAVAVPAMIDEIDSQNQTIQDTYNYDY